MFKQFIKNDLSSQTERKIYRFGLHALRFANVFLLSILIFLSLPAVFAKMIQG